MLYITSCSPPPGNASVSATRSDIFVKPYQQPCEKLDLAPKVVTIASAVEANCMIPSIHKSSRTVLAIWYWKEANVWLWNPLAFLLCLYVKCNIILKNPLSCGFVAIFCCHLYSVIFLVRNLLVLENSSRNLSYPIIYLSSTHQNWTHRGYNSLWKFSLFSNEILPCQTDLVQVLETWWNPIGWVRLVMWFALYMNFKESTHLRFTNQYESLDCT